MKNEGITMAVFLTFWGIVALMGIISGLHIAFFHPYLSAAFVAVCVAVYFMSVGE